MDDEKLLEKYKVIWNKIEDIKNINVNALPVYDDRYIKTKIGSFVGKVYTNFRGLNPPQDDIKIQSFIVVSTDSLLACDNKYYLQVYLNNCAYKSVNKQMKDYPDKKFKRLDNINVDYDRIDISKGIYLAKSSICKEFMICHYWFFNHGFKFQYLYAMVVMFDNVLM